MLTLNPQELGAVLTGLRMLQVNLPHMGGTVALRRILTDDGAIEPISFDAINDLCERINCTPELPIWAVSVPIHDEGTNTYAVPDETIEGAIKWANETFADELDGEVTAKPIENFIGGTVHEICAF